MIWQMIQTQRQPKHSPWDSYIICSTPRYILRILTEHNLRAVSNLQLAALAGSIDDDELLLLLLSKLGFSSLLFPNGNSTVVAGLPEPEVVLSPIRNADSRRRFNSRTESISWLVLSPPPTADLPSSMDAMVVNEGRGVCLTERMY